MVEAKAHIENAQNAITSSIFSIYGWFSSKNKTQFEILLNGIAQERVVKYNREDIKNVFPNGYASAWKLNIDTRRHLGAEQPCITIEVRSNGNILARKYMRCLLPNDSNDEKTILFFMHIPKTGGTSLKNELRDKSDYFKILYVYDDNEHLNREEFIDFSAKTIKEYDMIFGHFDYGLHHNFNGRYKYLSLIRDPYDMVLSFYFYMKYDRKEKNFAAYNTIYDVLSDQKEKIFDNVLVRMFSGTEDIVKVSKEHYDSAIRNIEKDFHYIGLTEHMQESADYIGRYLGFDIAPDVLNKTTISDEFSSLDKSNFRKYVGHLIQYDIMLYDYVKKRFFGYL